MKIKQMELWRSESLWSSCGHVSTPTAMMSNPFVFFRQVNDQYYACRSDNLLLLTCTLGVRSIVSSVFNLAGLLLCLSGDVESNFGPSVEELLSEILGNQKQMAADIQKNFAEIKGLQRNVDGVTEERIRTVDSSLHVIKDSQGIITALDEKISKIESKLIEQEYRD